VNKVKIGRDFFIALFCVDYIKIVYTNPLFGAVTIDTFVASVLRAQIRSNKIKFFVCTNS